MRQSVVHLGRALGVANVKYLVLACHFLDGCDVSDVVVHAHVGPGPVPVLCVHRCIESLVAPTVHGTTVVSNPDIVASVDQLQMEGLITTLSVIEGSEPGCAVLEIAVLDENGALGGFDGVTSLACDVESGQQVVILRGDRHGFPIVTICGHCFSKPSVLLSRKCHGDEFLLKE